MVVAAVNGWLSIHRKVNTISQTDQLPKQKKKKKLQGYFTQVYNGVEPHN